MAPHYGQIWALVGVSLPAVTGRKAHAAVRLEKPPDYIAGYSGCIERNVTAKIEQQDSLKLTF